MGHQTPASPATEYLYTTVLSFRMLCVFETTVPIDDSETFKVIRELLLPLNPRFSSILVKHAAKSGLQWQRVNMNLEDHVKVPSFPKGLSSAQYEEHWYDYLSQISMESFPEQRPLWEVHLFKYPFSNAAGAVVLKLHHALGDGFSLMGALFSSLKRADNPSLSLTFPATSSAAISGNSMGEGERVVSSWGKKAISVVMGCCNTLEDVVKSLLHSTVMKDARSCIRSGRSQVEYLSTAFSSVVLSLARIKEVKNQVAGVSLTHAPLIDILFEENFGKLIHEILHISSFYGIEEVVHDFFLCQLLLIKEN